MEGGLEVSWQDPFHITKVLNDGLNSESDTGEMQKQLRTYHINLLSTWQSRHEKLLLSLTMPLPHERNVPSLATKETWKDVEISGELTEPQKGQVKTLLQELTDVFSGTPNLTNAATHQIDTCDSPPIQSTPNTVPLEKDCKIMYTRKLKRWWRWA